MVFLEGTVDQAEIEEGVTHQGTKFHMFFLEGIMYGYQKNNGKRAVVGALLVSGCQM